MKTVSRFTAFRSSRIALSTSGSYRLLFAFVFLLGLALAALAGSPTTEAATNLFATPLGWGTTCLQDHPCALQFAISKALDGDTVYVAAGTYTGTGAAVITVTKSITIYAGWDGAPSGIPVRNPALYKSILDGEHARRVVYMNADITPTIDGFTIQNGNATGLNTDCSEPGNNANGCGGGVFVAQGHPIISNNTITNNVATTSSGPITNTGYGGGIYLRAAPRALIFSNWVISNTGSTANAGCGGGIRLNVDYDMTLARINANRIYSNTATTMNTISAWGGGICGGPDGVEIDYNTLVGNRASGQVGAGWGAALYQWYGSAHYSGNLVTGNLGASDAVYLGYSGSTFEANRVVGNSTSSAINLVNGPGSTVSLKNNVVAHDGLNTLTTFAYLGHGLTVNIRHNTFVGTHGTGIDVEEPYVHLTLFNNIITGYTWAVTNTVPVSSTVTGSHNLFWSDTNTGIPALDPVYGDPKLTADYHLGPGSAAIDAALVAGVTQDIDWQMRPIGSGYDIGADEAPLWQFLPDIRRSPW